jgi:hypothetical protein
VVKVCESARVKLNGQVIGTLISSPYRIRIPQEWLKPDNVLAIEVSNLMGNRMADMDQWNVKYKKFYNVNFPAQKRENRDSTGLFNAADWAPRESGLIGPVKLVPAFKMRPR